MWRNALQRSFFSIVFVQPYLSVRNSLELDNVYRFWRKMGDFVTKPFTAIMTYYIGALYTSTILTSALLIKKPADGFLPQGYTPPATTG